jgi:hypothetical protein
MPLLGIQIVCPLCHTVATFCEHCWRNQKYCSSQCSDIAEFIHEKARKKRYNESEKGRESHRRRQKKLRIRKILGQSVLDGPEKKSQRPINPQTKEIVSVEDCCRCLYRIEIFVWGADESDKETKAFFHFSFVLWRSRNFPFSI